MIRIERYADREISEAGLVNVRTLVLPFDLRRKSRLRAKLDDGVEAALFLPRGTVLRNGDILQAVDGSLIKVTAAPERVLYVTADRPHDLMRAVYHLGNRHVPVELGENWLKLEADPVLEEMLLQLGVTLREDCLPFQPETGAYGGGHRHSHNSTNAEEHERAQQLFNEYHGQQLPEDQGLRRLHSHDDSRSHGHS